MIWKCHGILCFHFYFFFRNNGKNDFCCCYGDFIFRKCHSKSTSSQLLDRTFTTAFERHLAIEDFKDVDQHRCRTCTMTFDLLFMFLFLLNKPIIYLCTFWYSVHLEVHPVPLRFFQKNQENFDEAQCCILQRFTVTKC